MRSLTETVMRPWFTHHVVDRLRLWAQLVEVASMPWPERVRRGGVILAGDEARRAGSRNPANFHGLLEVGIIFGAFSQAIDATELVVDRTSRVAVAIERYRRDHDRLPGALSELVPQYLREIPDDPFSGGALRFRSERGAYTVYGVGHNQQDDGGDLSSELERVQQQGWGRRLIRGTDVGVRVLIQE